jgi:hypothetical protein
MIWISVVFIFIPDVILLFVLVELLVFTIYFTVAEFYFLATVIVFLLYFGLKYNDHDEYTGARSWKFLRKFTFNPSVQYTCMDKYGYDNNEKILFIVMGNMTNFSMFSGFGLHGNVFEKLDLNYVMPPILFKIPILRDILLWSGAVTYRKEDKVATVLELLKRNKSVAYCPSGMNDLLKNDGEEIENPTTDVFEFCMKHAIKIVPVLIQGEEKRYHIRRSGWISKVQMYCMAKWGWPFPLWFFVKCCDKNQPPKVIISMGPIMDCSVYTNSTILSQTFINIINQIV